MCRLRAVVDRWFFLRSVRLTLDSTLEHAHAYTRSVRAFGINLPLCDSQPIFFFRFFSLPSPSRPFPSLPFFLRFFRFSSSFSFSARTRFLPLLLRPIPSFPFDKSLPEIPTKNHVVRSCSRYSIGGYQLPFANRFLALSLSLFLFLCLSPYFSKRVAQSRVFANIAKDGTIFFAYRPLSSPLFLSSSR